MISGWKERNEYMTIRRCQRSETILYGTIMMNTCNYTLTQMKSKCYQQSTLLYTMESDDNDVSIQFTNYNKCTTKVGYDMGKSIHV